MTTKHSKKSKLPDLNEVVNIVGKLFNDLKKSIGEIIEDYKVKHDVESKKEKTKAHKHKTTKHETKEKH